VFLKVLGAIESCGASVTSNYIRKLEDHNFDETVGFLGRCSIWASSASGQTSSTAYSSRFSKFCSSDFNERPSILCSADIMSRWGKILEHSSRICGSNSELLFVFEGGHNKLTVKVFKSCGHLYQRRDNIFFLVRCSLFPFLAFLLSQLICPSPKLSISYKRHGEVRTLAWRFGT
jgi:hypothetical protein